MEKILQFIQWWMNLNTTKKVLSFFLGAGIWVLMMILSLNINFSKKDNLTLKETLDLSKECEQRAARLVAEERNKCDSISTIKENKFDEERKIFYNRRTPVINTRNKDIKNALK